MASTEAICRDPICGFGTQTFRDPALLRTVVTAPRELSGNSIGFFEILATTRSSSRMTKSMKKALSKLRGVNPDLLYNSERTLLPKPRCLWPPRQTGEHSIAHHWPTAMGREAVMVYSYTQISQYLRCPSPATAIIIWMGGVKRDPGSDGLRSLL